VALAVVLILAGAALWLIALVGLIRDSRAARWQRITVGLLLVALPPVALVYWFRR
jgi:hypothetical protein